eukprot:COSAG02_NODE_5276_length_4478_cov_1.851108_2_plen_92_part_00
MFFGVMLQSELAAESLESDPDYRAGAEILANTLEESGLEDQTFVRAVGEVRDTLLHTPAPAAAAAAAAAAAINAPHSCWCVLCVVLRARLS